MAEPTKDNIPIVTLRTLLSHPGVESTEAESATDPELQDTINRYNEIVAKLEEETERASANVMITVQDPYTSVLQSRIAEAAESGYPLPGGGTEAVFGEGATG